MVLVLAASDGRVVSYLEVIINGVADVQIFNLSSPCARTELTVIPVNARGRVQQDRRVGTGRCTVCGDSVVKGRSNTHGGACVHTSSWVTSIRDGHGDGSARCVRILERTVVKIWLERVRRWSNVADLVGDSARHNASLAGTECKSTPSVGAGGSVHGVVSWRTAVVVDGPVEVVPTVAGNAHAVCRVGATGGVELERSKVSGDVAWNGELVRLRGGRPTVGHRSRSGVAAR